MSETDFDHLLAYTNSTEQPTQKASVPVDKKKIKKPTHKAKNTSKSTSKKPKKDHEKTEKRSFEFYVFHIQELNRIKYELGMDGVKITLNELAREAMDLLIKKYS